jgi:hypothetical protein
MDETPHLRRRCFHLRAEASAAAERSGCQIRPLAWCLGWERSGRMNPIQVGDGTPWSESGLHSPVFARWLRGLIGRRRSTRGHRCLTVNALVPLARSVRDIRPETRWHPFARFSYRNRLRGTSRSHPAEADKYRWCDLRRGAHALPRRLAVGIFESGDQPSCGPGLWREDKPSSHDPPWACIQTARRRSPSEQHKHLRARGRGSGTMRFVVRLSKQRHEHLVGR